MIDSLQYWGLKERPFETTWDVRFFYQSHAHAEALDRLLFLAGERSMNLGVLTGEIGCGKTLIRAQLAKQLDPNKFMVVSLENSSFTLDELLTGILNRLDPKSSHARLNRYAKFEKLKEEALALHEAERHLVLIFDEAQELPAAGLAGLKNLTNFNGDGANLLTIILTGQPELRHQIQHLPAVNQRVSLRYHLGPLSLPETGEYLSHRMRAAGHESGDVFTPDAVEVTFQASRGIPREINRLAKLALEQAWNLETPLVEASAIEAVASDIERQQTLQIA